ncbi:hypothetical protein J437_LFUL016299 [Ladona fulva]|uniref:Protein strawberry notch n=1 Tax=Ladona fulva TaxID=123851 RepID=A0A8K0KMD7_LADFU|nr:hypothetical protein J437_LFUL016299 [Ladona fulva]
MFAASELFCQISTNVSSNKIPGGLVTKGNSHLGYEVIRVGNNVPGGQTTFRSPAPVASPMMGPMGGFGMMGTLGNLGGMGGLGGAAPYGSGAGMGGYYPSIPGGMNPMQYLQQSFSGLDYGSLSQALQMNPYLLANGAGNNMMSQLMNPAFHQGWAGGLSGKTVNQLWMKEENKMNPLAAAAAVGGVEEEEGAEDDEDMGVAETYADYMPSKLKLGRKHPDPVVETASLSSVSPTEVWYKLTLPEEIVNSGSLSALQLEAVVYASQQHEHFLPDGTRAGFLIGDGAGVGKGRTISGIIYENYLKGRKRAIWVSVSNDLKYDSQRDLNDIGAGKIDVHALNKFKYAKISSAINGNVKKGVIFSTYSALIGESTQSGGKYKTRLKQLLQWCGEDFDGCVSFLQLFKSFSMEVSFFDECHRAKNLCPTGSSKPTKTGLTVLELQNKLPRARVVYASATGASEPKNMAYMTRLGIWGEGTPFREFTDFITAVEKRQVGVGAMEIVAMDMKLRGMYIARQLSFHGVAFKVEEVPLSKEFVDVYDDSVKLWVEALTKFQEAAELIDAEQRMKKTMWGQFWSAHQRFFKYLCIAAKVKHAVRLAREAVKCGKCVVIGLQSTGEARTLEALEREDGELSDFVSTAKAAQKAKRVKYSSSDESDSERERNSSGSEFKLTASDSEESEERSEDSQASDDFNPFYDDSDSDAGNTPIGFGLFCVVIINHPIDPWVGRKKKMGKKRDKKPSKRQSTQDKISTLLAKKGKMKGKRNGDGGYPVVGGNVGLGDVGSGPPPRDAIERACRMKEELLAKVEDLGERLPPNTLDQLIDELGGPENVAEMTGRKGRVVQTEDGQIQYESRSEVDVPLETLNLTEKQRFMDGEKDVAIISEAASSGISLQSDRRARNQRRRVHITLELPWSADRAIQQFGRTHRSNQVNAPEYMFLISDLAGERRFASIVAKRLESLGALTHGDRRATETRDLSRFNIDNKYGRAALEATMKTIMGYEPPLVAPPSDYKGDFFKDVAGALVGVGLICNTESMPGVLMLDKDYNNMSKFLNRILGMPVDLQNRLFKYFTDTLNAIVTQAKKTGRYDMGILDLGTAGENVRRVKLYTYLRKHSTGSAVTELHIVQVERGMSWEEATDRANQLTSDEEGFYLSHQIRNGKQTAILAIAEASNSASTKGKKDSKKDKMFTVYRPNTGLQLRQESLGELEKKYRRVSSEDEAKGPWTEQYEASLDTCSHAYWRGNCRNVGLGLDCEVGLRRRTYNVLSGSVLSVWSRVEGVLAARSGHNSKMQVVRLRTECGVKIVGTLIPNSCVESLREALSADAEKTDEQVF